LSANKRHHTVRTVYALCITAGYITATISATIQGVNGYLIFGGLAAFSNALILLYTKKKGKGEEDRRSDESVL